MMHVQLSVLETLRRRAEATAAYTLCTRLWQLVNKGEGLKLSSLLHGAKLIKGRR